MHKSDGLGSGTTIAPDDVQEIEIVQDQDGGARVRLQSARTGAVVERAFPNMEQAIAFYETLWSARTSVSDDEPIVKVGNLR